jgi:hypothetical protein
MDGSELIEQNRQAEKRLKDFLHSLKVMEESISEIINKNQSEMITKLEYNQRSHRVTLTVWGVETDLICDYTLLNRFGALCPEISDVYSADGEGVELDEEAEMQLFRILLAKENPHLKEIKTESTVFNELAKK